MKNLQRYLICFIIGILLYLLLNILYKCNIEKLNIGAQFNVEIDTLFRMVDSITMGYNNPPEQLCNKSGVGTCALKLTKGTCTINAMMAVFLSIDALPSISYQDWINNYERFKLMNNQLEIYKCLINRTSMLSKLEANQLNVVEACRATSAGTDDQVCIDVDILNIVEELSTAASQTACESAGACTYTAGAHAIDIFPRIQHSEDIRSDIAHYASTAFNNDPILRDISIKDNTRYYAYIGFHHSGKVGDNFLDQDIWEEWFRSTPQQLQREKNGMVEAIGEMDEDNYIKEIARQKGHTDAELESVINFLQEIKAVHWAAFSSLEVSHFNASPQQTPDEEWKKEEQGHAFVVYRISKSNLNALITTMDQTDLAQSRHKFKTILEKLKRQYDKIDDRGFGILIIDFCNFVFHVITLKDFGGNPGEDSNDAWHFKNMLVLVNIFL